MQENKIIFFVFKKSMEKHIFKTSNIFLYIKKEHSKHVRVLAVCNEQENKFIYIYVYLPQWRQKPGILNTRLVYIFYNIKKFKL